ncbi:hypothetical protein [Trichormus variabilis]|uniref:hypothetical protein n=1 Tax=Anabaena variabilis TaxID=264691 RepID=UPI0013156FB1|nr:hypothetical protein [Trichormus variabilis]MBD2627990.1 hypothetical protein [Trichormus variabilis FACHB-164]
MLSQHKLADNYLGKHNIGNSETEAIQKRVAVGGFLGFHLNQRNKCRVDQR